MAILSFVIAIICGSVGVKLIADKRYFPGVINIAGFFIWLDIAMNHRL